MSLAIKLKRCNSRNYKNASRTKDDIEYLVIHYTGDEGDTAEGNGNYFAENTPKTSAHYFCDEDSIVQSVPDADIAWHCGKDYSGGTAAYWKKCLNSNSIGIEICMHDKRGNIRQGSIDMAVKLARQLMSTYDIAVDHVIRHYDVCHKDCPAPFVANIARWAAFKAALTDSSAGNTKDHEEDEEMTQEQFNTMFNNALASLAKQEPGEWSREARAWAEQSGLIQGDTTGNKQYQSALTREAFVVMAYRLYKLILKVFGK